MLALQRSRLVIRENASRIEFWAEAGGGNILGNVFFHLVEMLKVCYSFPPLQ